MKTLWFVLVLLLLASTCPQASWRVADANAQSPLQLPGSSEPVADQPAPIDPSQIEARLASLRRRLVDLGVSTGATDTARARHDAAVRDRLLRIELLLSEQEALAKPAESVDAKPTIEAPPSVSGLNALHESQESANSNRAQFEEDLKKRRTALDAAKTALDAAERARRAVRAQIDGQTQENPAAARDMVTAELNAEIAREELNLRTLEARTAKRRLDNAEVATVFESRIRRVKEALRKDEADPTADSAALAAREGELRRAREVVARRLVSADLQASAARSAVASLTQPASELVRIAEAMAARRDAVAREIDILDGQIERLELRRDLWQRWNDVLKTKRSSAMVSQWERETESAIRSLVENRILLEGNLTDLERRLATVVQQIDEETPDSDLRASLDLQAEALRRLRTTQREGLAALNFDHRLAERVLAEIRFDANRFDLRRYAGAFMGAVKRAWSHELTSVDDAPITVGSLALAFALFVVGLYFSRRGSSALATLCEKRFSLDPGAAQAVQTISFYLLLVAFTLMALRAIHFPLTAFTVLGGALAIGLGFGSQNVMNNFISGLILMFERPVRAQDLVEVDGNHGIIERIGARSTQIRSTDGRHIVVPNSFFLESNVVNWTLSDDLIRTSVVVGVIYGSPTRLVEKLIRQVVEEEPKVLSKPAPVIVFEEFGDNSLNFRVHFWVKARSPMETRTTQSLVRFRIDDLFREHELVIAFPQRDVHLDTVAPLEVRVVGPGKPKLPGSA